MEGAIPGEYERDRPSNLLFKRGWSSVTNWSRRQTGRCKSKGNLFNITQAGLPTEERERRRLWKPDVQYHCMQTCVSTGRDES